MSTIRHPVQNHAWWYAAAAAVVLAGVLAVLMATVLTDSGTSGSPDDGPLTNVQTLKNYGGRAYAPPCFAGHAGASIELAHAGCPAGTP